MSYLLSKRFVLETDATKASGISGLAVAYIEDRLEGEGGLMLQVLVVDTDGQLGGPYSVLEKDTIKKDCGFVNFTRRRDLVKLYSPRLVYLEAMEEKRPLCRCSQCGVQHLLPSFKKIAKRDRRRCPACAASLEYR